MRAKCLSSQHARFGSLCFALFALPLLLSWFNVGILSFEFLFTIRFLLAVLQACRLNNTTCRFSNATCLVWFALFYFVCVAFCCVALRLVYAYMCVCARCVIGPDVPCRRCDARLCSTRNAIITNRGKPCCYGCVAFISRCGVMHACRFCNTTWS